MWMMGCSSDSSSLTVSDSCNPRKLRPIVPKPHIYPTARAVSSSSWLSLSNEEEPISVFHSLMGEEQRRRELGTQVSSRWNPTPDQLRILDDLYKRGTRTPTAVQIQCITAQLRCYGKIEGKNVFYWFQNHKARERQKRRRRIEAATELVDCYIERKDSGSASCWIDFEQSKEWVSPQWRIRPEEPILSYGEERAVKPSQGSWKTSLQFKGDNITCQQNPNIKTPDLNFPEISTPPTTPINKDPGETSTIETLQLFPLHNNANNTSTTSNNSTTVPTSHQSHKNIIQYFQFLPLKN